jgi:hypothetical protein
VFNPHATHTRSDLLTVSEARRHVSSKIKASSPLTISRLGVGTGLVLLMM